MEKKQGKKTRKGIEETRKVNKESKLGKETRKRNKNCSSILQWLSSM